MNSLCDSIYFDEIATTFSCMQTECKNFMAGLKQIGAKIESSLSDVYVKINTTSNEFGLIAYCIFLFLFQVDL